MNHLDRPFTFARDTVYSNFDHVLDATVVCELKAAAGEVYAQHAAYNFCGFVWLLPDGRWVNQIWRHGTPVDDIYGNSIESVIEVANNSYGSE